MLTSTVDITFVHSYKYQAVECQQIMKTGSWSQGHTRLVYVKRLLLNCTQIVCSITPDAWFVSVFSSLNCFISVSHINWLVHFLCIRLSTEVTRQRESVRTSLGPWTMLNLRLGSKLCKTLGCIQKTLRDYKSTVGTTSCDSDVYRAKRHLVCENLIMTHNAAQLPELCERRLTGD